MDEKSGKRIAKKGKTWYNDDKQQRKGAFMDYVLETFRLSKRYKQQWALKLLDLQTQI